MDDKEGEITGATFEELEALKEDSDPYIRNAARRSLQQGLAKGGIDFNSDKMNLSVQDNGHGEIKFHIDRAMLQQLQNAPGFIPQVIDVQPLKSLPAFLGFSD
ncbi:MAG: hypothetical protein HY591_05455 [Candidatus Omnitrophica bacterium]|nr:hypothetical protein [Candidatus Omnitrophota bacterium]